MHAIHRALRIVEMLEHFERQNGVERVSLPFQLVHIAADVRLFSRIDVEPQIRLCRHIPAVRRRLRADVQHTPGFSRLNWRTSSRSSVIRFTDRMFSVGMRGQTDVRRKRSTPEAYNGCS